MLILQGGGSLGAYECGVYKTLHKHNIVFDIVAGTSIGGVNASIIAASKTDEPAVDLENFWLSLTEDVSSSFLTDEARVCASSIYSAFWGNHNGFQPIWFTTDFFTLPYNKPYIYDITPLKNTLKEYVDFAKLKKPNRPRLVITSTDIQNGSQLCLTVIMLLLMQNMFLPVLDFFSMVFLGQKLTADICGMGHCKATLH